MKIPGTVSRRTFLAAAVSSGVALAGAPSVSAAVSDASPARDRIAFVTANLVAQVTNYRFSLEQWGDQHKKTVAATDETAWRAICKEIASKGYHAVEIWEAHAAPEVMDKPRATLWKSILEEHGLKAIGYGGILSRKTLDICQWMGIPQINGWIGDSTPEQATALCRDTGVRFNIENHPQKTAKEVLDVVAGGNEWLGVCVDTGWFGTQGVSGPDIIRTCGKLVRHTHLKDVKAAGAHHTCLLGEGVAQVAKCIEALKQVGYAGWYSWEDEPEDRNPFDSAVRNREWIAGRLA